MADPCPTPAENPMVEPRPEIVVITGMSGAGRSEAIHTFEDLGYFCIDNLPPSFIPALVELALLPDSRMQRLAVVSDVRVHDFMDELAGELKLLDERGIHNRVLFLEADDDTLLRRFKQTRRPHPLCEDGESVLDGVRSERTALGAIRSRADVVIDTSLFKPRDLREQIRARFFSDSPESSLAITVSSFGFKYGIPADADIVMDVRFLPNPYYDPVLRSLTGLDAPVREYVLGNTETVAFLERWLPLLATVVPGYVDEGKHHLAICIGCTGGMHRSVAISESTSAFLRENGYRVAVSHRDIGRDRETG